MNSPFAERVLVFLAGATGGMSPTVLRVTIDLVSQNVKLEKFDLSFTVGLLLLGTMGGIVALLFGERDLRKVLYIGVGLPSLFVVGAGSATNRTGSPADTVRSSLFSPAHVLAARGDVSGRTPRVVIPKELRDSNPEVIFVSGGASRSVPVRDGDEIAVPETARSVQVRTTLGDSAVTTLPGVANTASELKIKAEKNQWSGFLYAIGGHADPYNVTIQLTMIGAPGANDAALFRLSRTVGVAVPVDEVAVSQDGKMAVVTAGFPSEEDFNVLDLGTGTIRTLARQTFDNIVALIPGGVEAVLAGGRSQIWNLNTGKVIRELPQLSALVTHVAVTADGARVVAAWRGGTNARAGIGMVELKSGRLLRAISDPALEYGTAALAPDGKRAIAVGAEGTLNIWSLESGRLLRTISGGQRLSVYTVAVTPDGKTAISGSLDGTVNVWNLESEGAPKTFTGHSGPVRDLAVSPDGRWVTSASEDGTLRIWRLDTESWVGTYRNDSSITTCAFIRSVSSFIIGDSQGHLHVVEFQAPKV